MGPEALEASCAELADRHGAQMAVIRGDDLLAEGFPLIHTVGRAAAQAPRLIDMRWGDAGPTLTLVGKGVCFDTGGLNLKPASGMGLMKKDMGGAATVLGLAQMIMTLGLALRLRVLIPAVENSVSAAAFRPGDILTARNGLTVEINNTDAEGRLVLADALSLGAEEAPDLMVSMATLTGAARVAVGGDIAPYFTDDARFATALDAAAERVADPVWRMPFHAPYESMIEPGIADLDNAPSGGFAGSITAALFLRRFVERVPYTHFDIYAWQANGRPRPAQGRRRHGRARCSMRCQRCSTCDCHASHRLAAGRSAARPRGCARPAVADGRGGRDRVPVILGPDPRSSRLGGGQGAARRLSRLYPRGGADHRHVTHRVSARATHAYNAPDFKSPSA